jgi:hypothetical protein
VSGSNEYMGESIGNISRLAPCIFAARQTKVDNKFVTFSSGKHLPSTKLEQIDTNEFKRGHFVSGDSAFGYFDTNEMKYVDLTIKKSDLNRAPEKMKEEQV